MSKAHMQVHTNKDSREKQSGGNQGRTRPKWTQPASLGRQTQPISGPVRRPFDLAALWTIYSTPTKSHEGIHSSSATEEQRREGHRSR
jgi:hypothetical protein